MFSATKFTPTPNKFRREKTTLSSNSDSESELISVHVFCRLRPLEEDSITTFLKLLSAREISVAADIKGIAREICYKFKHVFTAYASQKEIFDHVALPLVEDLLRGRNGLLFAYGVTGSGKTYTLNGHPNNPGIVPRCIDAIFNSIAELQTPKFIIKPDKMNGFELQTEDDAIQERYAEIRTAHKTPKLQRKPSKEKNIFNNEGSKIPLENEKSLYAVFVSYVEIYNNFVYDLLDESNIGKTFQNKILREDSRKNVYVNGVVEVEVKSAEEALEVFSTGKKRKKMANTILNSESSRSHSVFNIRVVQLVQETINGNGKCTVPEKNTINISQLSLVDLAGSERTNRTQNFGTRLREASCINNSLMNLRSCFETLRENQRTNSNQLVPYRGSRLTYLFKSFFEGQGSIEMVVCINPSIDNLEENIHVLKFAEITQDVQLKLEPRTPITSKRTICRRIATPAKVKAGTFALHTEIPTFKFDLELMEECTPQLHNLKEALKRGKKQQASVNEESERAHEEFRKHLVEAEKERLYSKSQILGYEQSIRNYKQKVVKCNTKIYNLENYSAGLASKNEELEGIINTLHGHLNEKDMKLNQNLLEREKVKQKMVLKNQKMSHELDAKLKRQRDHLNAAMKEKDLKLKKVREALESDICTGGLVETGVENVAPKPTNNLTYRRNMERHVASSTTRRRSRSVGDTWLEHNSVKPIPLGTVMQPTIKKRKSVTKLTKASDVTNPKQSRYCLVTQETDNDGEMETKVYKGDIVPTCGGGAQVIFNDVERLRQESPTASPTT